MLFEGAVTRRILQKPFVLMCIYIYMSSFCLMLRTVFCFVFGMFVFGLCGANGMSPCSNMSVFVLVLECLCCCANGISPFAKSWRFGLFLECLCFGMCGAN